MEKETEQKPARKRIFISEIENGESMKRMFLRGVKEREQLRKELLECMCECAERINVAGQLGIGLILDKKMPSFKPGVSDKMIFMEIIEANMPTLEYDFNVGGFNTKHLGFGLMLQFYYPKYEGELNKYGLEMFS